LIDALNGQGYRGSFDYVFVPKDTKKGVTRGGSIAFVNFSRASVAEDFCQRFHHDTLPGVSLPETRLEVLPANVQGFKANFDLRLNNLRFERGLSRCLF
jgi:hypothetical protein